MRIHLTLPKLAAALSITLLPSCSLPPQQAWQAIRRDGLLTYIKSEVNSGSNASKQEPQQAAPTKPTAPAQNQAATSIVATNVPPPSQLSSSTLPVAQTVPGLSGYVRTPFTNPPRLVDVRGMTSGSKVVCPFTHKAFIVPQMTDGERQVATVPVSNGQPTPAPVKDSPQPVAEAPAKPAPTKTTPKSGQVAVNTHSNPLPAPNTVTPAPSAPVAPATEMPFGIAIPGRPGFVNSPFAAKHQLVDVTGLPAGMEVKCPYTGKLFRVPAANNNQQ